MKIKFDDAAMRQLYADIAKKIEAADQRFRVQHEGKPVAEVKPHVASAFSGIGVTLPEQQIADYAEAVSARKPFKWVLK